MISDSIEEILCNLGYELKSENGKYWRAQPTYRESSNKTSLRINKENGSFQDFSLNKSGSFKELVMLSLNLSSIKEASDWLNNSGVKIEYKEKKPKIKTKKIIKDFEYANLLPHYNFYTKSERKIDPSVFENIECGVSMAGRMSNRLTFIIRDEENDVIGMAGRDLLGYKDNKWKLIGRKADWIYPKLGFKPKKIYLVESVGDMLALNNAGIFGVLVLFGVSISAKQINYVSCLGCEIVISTNNDSNSKDNCGKNAAEEIYRKLLNFVDENKISIKLPQKNDWGETPKEEIQKILL